MLHAFVRRRYLSWTHLPDCDVSTELYLQHARQQKTPVFPLVCLSADDKLSNQLEGLKNFKFLKNESVPEYANYSNFELFSFLASQNHVVFFAVLYPCPDSPSDCMVQKALLSAVVN